MESSAAPTTSLRATLWRPFTAILFARMVLDTGTRAVYPFLPFIATSLGVSAQSAAIIIQSRNLTGLLSPLFGPLSDRYGRRALMLGGLAVAAVAGMAVWFVSSLWLAVVVLTVMTLSTILFVPAQQAFWGDNVPYAQRGRVIALSEVAWALAGIIGLPLVAILVKNWGWQSGFVAIGVCAFVGFVVIWFVLPSDKPRVHAAARALGGSYSQALRAPMALAVLSTMFLLAATNENINVNYGEWMHESFGLDPLALGAVAAAIGGAELSSELFAAGFVDRVGKWRMVAGSLILGGLGYLALPFFGSSAQLGTVGLVLTYFMFELGVVAALPIVSELAPLARATLLSLGVGSFSLGRALGSFTGPLLYANGGFTAATLASAAGVGLALCIWLVFVREHGIGRGGAGRPSN